MELWVVLLLVLVALACVVGIAGIGQVRPEHVGVVVARFGKRRGPRVGLLRQGVLHWRVPLLTSVEQVPVTRVPHGTIGLVVAKVGAPSTSGLARHVECDRFTDGERFLRDGGELGRQLEVLPGGEYEINPYLFDVATVLDPDAMARFGVTAEDLREITITIGETGVVVTHIGAPPADPPLGAPVDGHDDFGKPWEFLARGGQRGVQQVTLPEGGVHAINPWFAHVVRVPTRWLLLEWSDSPKESHRLDAALGELKLTVEGYTVRLGLHQTFRIPARSASELVRRFSDESDTSGADLLRRFVEYAVAPAVLGYLRQQSDLFRINDFVNRSSEIAADLADHVRHVLAQYGIEAQTTTLTELTIDEPEFAAIRRRIAMQRQRVQLEAARLEELAAQRDNERVRAEIETQRVRVEQERRELAAIELRVLTDVLGADARERLLARVAATGVHTEPGTEPSDDTLSWWSALSAEQTSLLSEPTQVHMLLEHTPSSDRAIRELDEVYRRNIAGERCLVQAFPEPVHSLPVSIYLSHDTGSGEVEAAVVDLLDVLDVDITTSRPPVIGSWLGLRLGRFRRSLASEEAREILARAERAIEARVVGLPQAEIDSKLADAAAKLITALENQPDAFVQLGSLFVLKINGMPIVRNLSPREMSFLVRHQTTLTAPEEILRILELANNPGAPTPAVAASEEDDDIGLPEPQARAHGRSHNDTATTE